MLNEANKHRYPKGEGKIKTFSEHYKNQAQKLLGHILRAPDTDPMRQVTFRGESGSPLLADKNRVGRPRLHWTIETMSQAWNGPMGKKGVCTPGRQDMENEILAQAKERKF